jgi:hypothetical protein
MRPRYFQMGFLYRPIVSPELVALQATAATAFGPGFVKAEGTDTCIKVGGSFRVDVSGTAGRR